MTRGLRRAHLVLVTGVALTLAATLPRALSNIPGLPSTARLYEERPTDAGDGRVVAAAAWVVVSDTLFLEILSSPASTNRTARFRASSAARWPDAVLLAWPGPLDQIPEGEEIALGSIAAGEPLTVLLPGSAGAIRLLSRAWSRELGRWAVPLTDSTGSR